MLWKVKGKISIFWLISEINMTWIWYPLVFFGIGLVINISFSGMLYFTDKIFFILLLNIFCSLIFFNNSLFLFIPKSKLKIYLLILNKPLNKNSIIKKEIFTSSSLSSSSITVIIPLFSKYLAKTRKHKLLSSFFVVSSIDINFLGLIFLSSIISFISIFPKIDISSKIIFIFSSGVITVLFLKFSCLINISFFFLLL